MSLNYAMINTIFKVTCGQVSAISIAYSFKKKKNGIYLIYNINWKLHDVVV